MPAIQPFVDWGKQGQGYAVVDDDNSTHIVFHILAPCYWLHIGLGIRLH